MKLENQVTSLELSKKLKELGVKQESLFYWVHCEVVSPVGDYALETKVLMDNFIHKEDKIIASAFTVAELGEMLPHNSRTGVTMGLWECWLDYDSQGKGYEQQAETEANARAKMLIYLIENNLIK